MANLRNAFISTDLTEQLAIGIARLPVRVAIHKDYDSAPSEWLRVWSTVQ
jgi:hypothetical protein